MRNLKPDLHEFLRDVEGHQLTVIKDDGLYRHLRFRRDNTNNKYFDLITWPGNLCYTGDMGTYVFSRVADMFEFFREPEGKVLTVNPGYWSEKVLSTSVFGKGIEEFSVERFKEVLLGQWNNHFEEWKPDGSDIDEDSDVDDITDYHTDVARWEAEKASCWDSVESDILTYEDQHELFKAANEFEEGDMQFHDLWDNDFTEYTYYFIWCCWALVWGVRQYDAAVASEINRMSDLGEDE